MEHCTVTSHTQGPTTVAALAGRFDGRAQAPLLGVWDESAGQPLLLDFTGASALDGAGLSLLAWLGVQARREGRELTVAGFSPRCRQVLEAHLGGLVPLREPAAEGPAAACPADQWAGPLGRARAAEPPGGLLALNVLGRRVRGPLEGFGPLWHKVYSQPVPAGAAEVARVMRDEMPALWPAGNRLVLPPPGVAPGAVGFIELRLPGGVPLATGVRVLHADPWSFTFATLQGHMAAGWITFGAVEDDGQTLAQVRSLARTSDPLFDAGFTLFGHREQEAFWKETLAALAARFGVRPAVTAHKDCVDPARRWGAAANVLDNAGVRTGLAVAAGLAARLLGRGARR